MVDCQTLPATSSLHPREQVYSQSLSCTVSSSCKDPTFYQSIPQDSFDPLTHGILSPSQKNLLETRFVDLLDHYLQLYDPYYESSFFMRGALTQLVQVISTQFLKDLGSGFKTDTLLVAVIVYTEAYVQKTNNIYQRDLFALLVTASLIALKYWNDQGVSLKKIARLARVNLKDLLLKEMDFLEALDFELHISPSVFSRLIS
eukprot:TRINITY_DN7410_c0_g1_i1.p1 TRINITY_DN7410_c0_g1~~TRINITY_DN7410_c0_g1_i1.p1  ORF type:complete len:202 (-),score=40.65 TRINITY_DN7410_c0_g1_i1:129-734(-)